MPDFDDIRDCSDIKADIYMFAGAEDSQQSKEVCNVKTFELPDPVGKAGGACTSAFLQTLYRDDADDRFRYTWKETLELMREKIEEIGLTQVPQLSSGRKIDVNEVLHIVPPGCTGTKRALLVGINYVGEINALTGCQKDTRNMKEFLINVCGFKRENMLILMDDGKHHEPTKKLMEDAFQTLVKVSQPGDCIFFQFSGHGGQVQDISGDEDDGYDEILIPRDYKENGHILDDWIYDEFACKLRAGVHVVAMVDCCHSGTAMDLPYVCGVGESEMHLDNVGKQPQRTKEAKPTSDTDKKKSKKTSEKAEKSEKKKKKSKKDSGAEAEEEEPKKEKKAKKKKKADA